MHRPVKNSIIVAAITIAWLFVVLPLAIALANASSYIGNVAAIVLVLAAGIVTSTISSILTTKEPK